MTRTSVTSRPSFLALAATLAAMLLTSLLACGQAPAPSSDEAEATTLVVYSGRNENLVGPLLNTFEEQSGITVEVRYGGTAELAAALLEEGAATPADVYISQDAAALGKLSAAGMLQALPGEILERIPARFTSPQGAWIGLSGRARTLVYNTERMTVDELPKTLAEVADERFLGRFGIAPTNASLQAHLAVYAAEHGSDALAEVLQGIADNEPQFYPKNTPIVEAVINGEIDFGLVNHYYLWRALQARPDAPAANHFPETDGFVNVAGAGILEGTEQRDAAEQLLRFLVSDSAQQYFAQETFEYPLAEGILPAAELPAIETVASPAVDFRQVAELLENAQTQLRDSGLLP